MRTILVSGTALVLSIGSQNAQAGSFLQELGKKLQAQQRAAAPAKPENKEKPLQNTPTGYGKNDELVVGIEKIVGGQCRRAGAGPTAYKLSLSLYLWAKGDYGSQMYGPAELVTEDIAELNPRQVVSSTKEIRIPAEQLNQGFQELGYDRVVADKSKVVGTTLAVGLDPVGPCSRLNYVPYRGYSFAPPAIFLDMANPYQKNSGSLATTVITQKPVKITVSDTDSTRLGDAQGASTKTAATLSFVIQAR